MRKEIRFSGSGGQGLITAGIILGTAASIYEGKMAVQSQSYGPEARGGASKSEVIIDENDIHYPKVLAPDIVLALTQEAANKYVTDIKDGGILIVDSLTVTEPPKGNFQVYSYPILEGAANEVGKSIVANIVALAVVNEKCGLVSFEALEKAVLSMVPKGTEDLNKKALTFGKQMANG